MKRLATVLILVAALTAATASFAQTQRWEHGWFIYVAGGNVAVRTADFFQNSGTVEGGKDGLYALLVAHYGYPNPSDSPTEIEFLNALGYAGWELVSPGPGGSSDRWYLKRMIP